MERIGVLIAEDEDAVRQALVDLVSSEPSMDVVGAAKDADEAIEIARSEKPDVALLDVKMPGGGGPRAAIEIRKQSPQTHVVALSAYEDRRTVLEMVRAGVVGYVVKGTSSEEILHTIRRAMRGQGSLSVEVTAEVIQELAGLLDRSEALTEELAELNSTKSEMIQILSHELFTPITTIQGFALTVAEHGTELRPEDFQELADGVSRASARIRRLVGNLGAAARLDRETAELPARPVAAGELLTRAVSEFPGFEQRIVLPTDPALLARRVWADPELAGRAIVVVTENALAFSVDDEPVEVDVRARATQVEFAIADRGPGVPEELRGAIFGAFTQSDASSTRGHEGLGIGLYLAQQIMQAHGGQIELSPREGGGSIFRLVFPAFQES